MNARDYLTEIGREAVKHLAHGAVIGAAIVLGIIAMVYVAVEIGGFNG